MYSPWTVKFVTLRKHGLDVHVVELIKTPDELYNDRFITEIFDPASATVTLIYMNVLDKFEVFAGVGLANAISDPVSSKWIVLVSELFELLAVSLKVALYE